MFCFLEILNKNSQYYYSNIELDIYISIFDKIIAIMLLIEKRYI